jgi:HEAT repeat protein
VVSRTNLDLGDVGSVLRVMYTRRTTEPSVEMLQSVQARAAFVLEQLGPTAGSAAPALLVALRHGSGNQRLAAALALASVSPRHSRSVEILDAMLAGDAGSGFWPDSSVDPDSEVLLALARLPVVPRAGSWERAVAAVGLCQISEDRGRAVQVMASRWARQERGFRLNVLQPFTRVLQGEALPLLRVAGEDPDASVRRNAAVLASRLYPEFPTEVTEVLVRAGHDEDRAVRLAALAHLWRIRPDSDPAVDAALRALNDADESVRAAAASRLSRYSGPRTREIPSEVLRRSSSEAARPLARPRGLVTTHHTAIPARARRDR